MWKRIVIGFMLVGITVGAACVGDTDTASTETTGLDEHSRDRSSNSGISRQLASFAELRRDVGRVRRSGTR